MEDQSACHECGSKAFHEFEAYRGLSRVTSDCKPWPKGGRLCLCENCGLLQSLVTPEWKSECDQIYKDYSVYYQSGGVEQAVFDSKTGEAKPRSQRLIEELTEHLDIPETGKLLDFGCGNGGFLKACSRKLSGWDMAGAELSDKYRSEVLSIESVDSFFYGDFSEIPEDFDVISMIHLLEHVPAPGSLLMDLAAKLNESGHLFVQVPTPADNPFELLIADHCSHFTAQSLSDLATRRGLSCPPDFSTGWIPKELSMILKPDSSGASQSVLNIGAEVARTDASLEWLATVMELAQESSREQPIGVFGTSIGANWIAGGIGIDHIAFFVDEDPAREGTTHLGRPVLNPNNVGKSPRVLLPLAPKVADSIKVRLKALDFLAPRFES